MFPREFKNWKYKIIIIIIIIIIILGPDGDAGERARDGGAGVGGKFVDDAHDRHQEDQLRTGMAPA